MEDRKICVVDVDSAVYVGDGDDGVYVAAAEHDGKWYTSSLVDSDTGSFVDSLVVDDGPYDSEDEALEAGVGGALDWCMENEVNASVSLFVAFKDGTTAGEIEKFFDESNACNISEVVGGGRRLEYLAEYYAAKDRVSDLLRSGCVADYHWSYDEEEGPEDLDRDVDDASEDVDQFIRDLDASPAESPVLLTLSCSGDRVDESAVEFLDVEEDFQGRDLVTFRCPACGETHQSYRLG